MGCASSKNPNRCRNCKGGLSPVIVPRSYSMHVHHPAQHTGDSYHTVALTSSTIGSLSLCDSSLRHFHKHLEDSIYKQRVSDQLCEEKLISGNGFLHGDEENDIKVREFREKMNLDLEAKVIEARVWSSMINEKIPKIVPKTPIVTPPGEPETINTWELMEGLEDVSPLRSPNHLRSFSFDVVRIQPSHDVDVSFDRAKSRFRENVKSNSRVDDLEPPEIVSTFTKSLEEKGNCKRKSLGKEKVRLYFTSLRGIRKTYEDCCNIRIILKSLGIRIDERDVSMHSGFKDELKKLLEDKFNNGVGITLPRVFLGNKYLGGVEEIKKLNENGTLEKLIKDCEMVEDGLTGSGNECEACGDVRFVPCETCSGSCKIYHEGEEEEEEEEEEVTEYGFQRCPYCNENGLIRCPVCCE
ncbi:Glutaredoxin [Arabidopsis thaliana x Arabidopsis arenosa]|uniref:Glutaredoxin n=1 Tax=Arabidopsis thaliana x Arabidopsis arenosa TaxID=1240361 RepID=A0A8T1YD97_9BRAS|nr:Glutaredoxin [Arabidopsis thaliana x Arabidopsis arenosa]